MKLLDENIFKRSTHVLSVNSAFLINGVSKEDKPGQKDVTEKKFTLLKEK